MPARARSFIGLISSLLLIAFAFTPAAEAALKRYDMKRRQLQHQASLSPQAKYESRIPDKGLGLIDDSGANPVLVRHLWSIGGGTGLTVLAPELSGFAWFRGFSKSGPANDHPGTGSTASSINWGNMDGWTISGAAFCHSVPSYLCSLVPPYQDNVSVPSPLFSDNFDHGTWIFHGTGFISNGGRIFFTSPTNFGNSQYFDRGFQDQTGTVPAVPLIGIASVGLSVVALAISSIRRRRS